MDAKQKAELVRELRDRTGSGFLDVKKALEATNYDINKAIDFLQESGKAKAAKKGDRIAAEGLVRALRDDKKAIIYEINSETDFVSQNEQFVNLVDEIGQTLLKNNFSNFEQALQLKLNNGFSIAEAIEKATATIGEKISFRRVEAAALNDNVKAGAYTHANGRVASLMVVEAKSDEAARNVAMHIAAMNPEYMISTEVPSERIKKLELEFSQSPALANKPEKIKESIMAGMLNKALSEFTLLNQAFVMDNALSVEKYLSSQNAKAIKMIRFEVGEGIEKIETDFAAEVAAQMKK
ncbi:elongation factor Ts [Mycoplasma testudineum]|uniref:Elongation factor Ts n=1 Tax=Mycoplasma testudineum TaxID=244584 RepID=A0A4R6IGP6_9MOLU|nr:translation elongation factor Ts [Mycoplasma testudineum]OYD26420.1 translation elongation factor Ts [Mycoplasma testudineum]TDO21254.1 elongation factor Ts [Mycoplasma testudineum]